MAKKRLNCLFLLLICLSSSLAAFESRRDSYFSRLDQRKYISGFYIGPGLYSSDFKNLESHFGWQIGYTIKKKTDHRKVSVVVDLLFHRYEGISGGKKETVQSGLFYPSGAETNRQFKGIFLPFNASLCFYINGGKFEKDTGKSNPFFGIGLSPIYKKIKYTVTEGRAGFIAYGKFGHEMYFIAPNFSMRLEFKFHAEFASRPAGNIGSWFTSLFKDDAFSTGYSFNILVLNYVF